MAVVDGWRDDIRAGALGAADLEECLAQGGLESALASRLAADEASGVRPAINATGVVLHTGLGRAPIHPEVAERMRAVAEGYCVLEIETSTGERGRRDAELASLCRKLLGCEEAIAVNNNAGAAFLMVHGFAAGRETIVSRGELVEIGGSFRVPKILEAANIVLTTPEKWDLLSRRWKTRKPVQQAPAGGGKGPPSMGARCLPPQKGH